MAGAFQSPSRLTLIACAAPHYWSDPGERGDVAGRVLAAVAAQLAEAGVDPIDTVVIDGPEGAEAMPGGDMAVVVPMSGGVQPWIEALAPRFRAVALWPAYVPGTLDHPDTALLLERNAAPASIEMISLLRRTHRLAVWAKSAESVAETWLAVRAAARLGRARIVQIGGPEPWVRSCARDTAVYTDRLGLGFISIDLETLCERYRTIEPDRNSVVALVEDWMGAAEAIAEPDRDAVVEACRLKVAVDEIVDEHDADGVVIACFALIGALGTTACVTLSMLNDDPRYLGTCEGDLDSAATMALIKSLTGGVPWMANPVVGRDDEIVLAHCTAPRTVCAPGCGYRLRSHHESGLGVSPEVDLPEDGPITLVRIGDDARAMSLVVGTLRPLQRACTCRTQARVALPSLDRFLETSLGCHQVALFGDHARVLTAARRVLGLEAA